MALIRFALAFLAASTAAWGAPDYVGSERCAQCHGDVAKAWSGSHHALAWTPPAEDTVKADFDGTAYRDDAMSAKFLHKGGVFSVDVTEADGSTASYDIHSVVGIAPLQQFLIETEPGRLQSFDLAWDIAELRWYHLYPDQALPPGNGLHWTGPYKNYNARCAECHATGYEKAYDHRARGYRSTQAEIGVGCEACHGPGSDHIAWAEAGGDPPPLYGLTAALGAGAAEEIQQCAACHARREAFGDGNALPGTRFGDAYRLSLLRPGLYHADGQVLDEVYVYGSFLQSKMYASGVRCSNCHDPHSAALKATGNAVCTQCHSQAGNPAFPSLRRASYDTPEHHFHTPGTEGAACVNCHMIERVYMGIDGRRDHSFRVPRPDLAAATGGPDACTDCHSGKPPSWAAAEIAARFPKGRSGTPHFGEILAAGRADPAAAADALAGLAAAGDAPGIVRATALDLLRRAPGAGQRAELAALIEDPDALVRAAAVALQSTAPAQDRVLRVLPALRDPVRSVRHAAARVMLNAPIAHLPQSSANALRAAMAEWRASLANRLDFPETHLVTGGMAMALRHFPAARAAFTEAIRLDPQQVDAWLLLIRLARAEGQTAEALRIADAARQANPGVDLLQQIFENLKAESGRD